MVERSRILRLAGLALAGIVVVILAVGLAGYGLLQTRWAKDRAAALIAAELQPEGGRIEIGSLDGQLPQRIRLRGVSVYDGEGVWLRIEETVLEWNPLDLLVHNRIDAKRLLITRPHMLRGPVVVYTGAEDEPFLPSLPDTDIFIERLQIDDLTLDAEVAGVESHFDANGHIKLSADDDLGLHFELQRSTRREPTLSADVVYRRKTDTLNIDVTARELGRGPWAFLLGWREAPAWQIEFHGSGPRDNWKGRLEGGAEEFGRAALNLGIEGSEIPRIAFAGTVDVEQPDGALTSTLMAPPYDLNFDLALKEPNRISVSAGSVSNVEGRLDVSGSFDTSQGTLDILFAYQPENAQQLLALLAPISGGGLSLGGRLSGKILAPSMSLDAEAQELAIGMVRVSKAALSLRAREIRATEAFPIDVEAVLDGVSSARMSGKTMALPSLRFGGHGSIDGGAGVVQISSLEISSSLGAIKMSGAIPIDSEVSAPLHLALEGELSAAPFEDPDIESFLEDPLRIRALLTMSAPSDRYELSNFVLDHPLARVTGSASLPPSLSDIVGRADVILADLDLLAQRFDLPIAGGSLSLSGEVKGAISALEYSVRMASENLRVEDIQLAPLDASFALAASEQGTRGSLTATLGGFPGPASLTADLTFAGAQGPIEVHSFELIGPGATFSGHMRVASFAAPFEGAILGEITDLTPWTAKADTPLSGSARLSATFTDRQFRQDMKVQGILENFRLALPVLENLSGKAATVSLWRSDEPGGRYFIELRGGQGSLGPAHLDQFSLSSETDFEIFDIALDASGHFRGELNVSAAGRLEIAPQILTIDFSRLNGRLLETDFALTDPVRLVQGPDGIGLDQLAMNIGDGDLKLTGQYGSGALNATMELSRVQLRPISLFAPQMAFTGYLNGEASIASSGAPPGGKLRLDLAELAAVGYPDMAPIGGTLTADWNEGRIQFDIALTDNDQSHLRANGEGPLLFDAAGTLFTIPDDGPVSGAFSWRGDLGPVWDAFGSVSHQLRGTVDAKATLSGTAGVPQASGTVYVSDGSYLNYELGTVLKDVDLLFEASETEVVLAKATATDGGAGTISARGRILLDPARKFPAEIELIADKATLARAQTVTVKGGGTMNYTRHRGSALLKGAITTNEVEALLVDFVSADVAELEVQEIGGTEVARPQEIAENETVITRTQLDVTATVPHRAFIRGRGLDSEWQGEVRATGTADEPILTGTFELVRGRFEFAGRAFRITRGTVEFRGGSEINPWVDLESEYRDKEFKALAYVSGPVSSPKITLSSEPELPQDEVMARILFGTSVSELGPFEAVQLADAVRTLASPGRSAGLLGKARGTLGLDVFRIGGNGNGTGGTTVTGGKYLTDNIYIEIERGLTGEDDKISVEVEVTPHISVESELMQDTGGNIGVKWRKDY